MKTQNTLHTNILSTTADNISTISNQYLSISSLKALVLVLEWFLLNNILWLRWFVLYSVQTYLVAVLPDTEVFDNSVFFKDRPNISWFYDADGWDTYFSQ